MNPIHVMATGGTLCGETGTTLATTDDTRATCLRCRALARTHLLRHVPAEAKRFFGKLTMNPVFAAGLSPQESEAVVHLFQHGLVAMKYEAGSPQIVLTYAAAEAYAIAKELVTNV